MIRAYAAAAVILLTPGPPVAQVSERVTREVYLMGTVARLETYAATRAQGLRILDGALRVLERADGELSTWRSDSAISALNRQPVGRPWIATGELCGTVAELVRLNRVSGRTFDPAIGALVAAWGIHEGGRIPTVADLRQARAMSGMRLLTFDPRTCALTRLRDVRIDVGAWGKGEALDRVRHALPDVPWLIDLGGQVAVNRTPPGQPFWPVALAHPRLRDLPLIEVRVPLGSLATSGGSERDVVLDGRRIAHLLDPRTGEPAAFDGSVAVWHERALSADALSTALFVMGPDEGMKWATAHDVSAAFLLPDVGGAMRMTTGFRALLDVERAER